MPRYRAFSTFDEESIKHQITYYHNPSRWESYQLPLNSPLRNIDNWSEEIKYYNSDGTDYSDEIGQLPTTTGGVYVFYLKGDNLPFFENYILYIGRCRFTENGQNICKRAKEYISDTRESVSYMMSHWKNHLYYRFFPDTDNPRIDANEALLIRAIVPPFNEVIPNICNPQEPIPAF